MKNAIRLMTAAALTVLMSLAFAGSSQAYPDKPAGVSIEIDGDVLIGGNTFDFTATADFSNTESDSDCDWTVTYTPATNGPATQTGTGTSIAGTFDTPTVESRTDTIVTATCEHDDPQALGRAEVQAAAAPNASAVVTLLPEGSAGGGDSNGFLPGAGGAELWILVLGAALVIAGGGAYALSRRSSH